MSTQIITRLLVELTSGLAKNTSKEEVVRVKALMNEVAETPKKIFIVIHFDVQMVFNFLCHSVNVKRDNPSICHLYRRLWSQERGLLAIN